MRTLLRFSLKRRFINKISMILQVLFILIVLGAFFADKLSLLLHLDLHEPYRVSLIGFQDDEVVNESLWDEQGLVFVDANADLTITKYEDKYQVSGFSDPILQTKIGELLLDNHQKLILSISPDNVYDWMERYEHIQVAFDSVGVPEDNLKTQLIILLLTSLYFMLLNFIAVNSNEIIMEKTSHILALILSSVTPLEHFVSKLTSGMIQVIIQIFSSIGIVIAVGCLRYTYDKGQGLFDLLSKYLPLPLGQFDFKTLVYLLNFNSADIFSIFLSFVFLILGIFLVQILVLVLSSRVGTAEEAAAIQGPFYMILLILYYGSLSMNTPEQLKEGWGYVFSFIPISSMLLMPMRLLTHHVMTLDILIALMFSLIFAIGILMAGYPLYKKGLQQIK